MAEIILPIPPFKKKALGLFVCVFMYMITYRLKC
jgi:hypothetical protein